MKSKYNFTRNKNNSIPFSPSVRWGIKERIRNVMKFKKLTIIICAAAVLVCAAVAVFFLTDPIGNKEEPQNEDPSDNIEGTAEFEILAAEDYPEGLDDAIQDVVFNKTYKEKFSFLYHQAEAHDIFKVKKYKNKAGDTLIDVHAMVIYHAYNVNRREDFNMLKLGYKSSSSRLMFYPEGGVIVDELLVCESQRRSFAPDFKDSFALSVTIKLSPYGSLREYQSHSVSKEFSSELKKEFGIKEYLDFIQQYNANFFEYSTKIKNEAFDHFLMGENGIVIELETKKLISFRQSYNETYIGERHEFFGSFPDGYDPSSLDSPNYNVAFILRLYSNSSRFELIEVTLSDEIDKEELSHPTVPYDQAVEKTVILSGVYTFDGTRSLYLKGVDGNEYVFYRSIQVNNSLVFVENRSDALMHPNFDQGLEFEFADQIYGW